MKSLLYLMTAVMAGFLNLSLTACSVDYDGNDYETPEIIGTWDAVSNQYYVEGEVIASLDRVTDIGWLPTEP